MATVNSTGLTPAQTKTLQGIVNSNPTYAQSYSSGKVATPASISPTVANPHDAPGYNPATDPTSSVYKANLANPQTPTPVAPATPTALNTAQPNPATAQITPPNATPDLASAIAGKGSALTSEEMGSPQTLNDLASRYKQGLANIKATGAQPATSQGQAMTGIQASMPGDQTESPSVIGGIIETDSNFDSILTMYDDFMSPATQRKSLMDEYSQLSKSLGIEGMNAELIDTKRIIEGTEDDIRAEVTATGGMATDSQVLAMANARNKSLVKNYNYLLESRDNAMTQLNTMMNLSIQDRQMAEAEFDRKLGFAFKVAEFKERATNNARQTYMTLGDKMGWDTLLNSVSPYEKGIIGKTLGMNDTALSNLATQSQKNRLTLETENKLDLDIKKQTLANLRNKSVEAPTVKSINGVDSQWNPSTGKWEAIGSNGNGNELGMAKAQEDINAVQNLLNDKNIRTAVGPTILGRFIGAGFDRATGGRQNFIAGVETLRSQLTLDSLIQAKARGATFGALSEGELKTLSASASKIGTWAKVKDGNVVAYNASEKDFKKELEKINNYAKLDYVIKGGDPTTVDVQELNGHYYTKNSDGTITELR